MTKPKKEKPVIAVPDEVALPELESAVVEYAELLVEEDRLDEEYNTAFASFQERYADLIARRNEKRQAREMHETYLRKIAPKLYESLPEDARTKKLTPGVEIEERTRVSYDPKRLAKLLKIHFPAYLVPDKNALTALGEAMMLKPDLAESIRAVLPEKAFRVFKEPIASISGVKVMSGILQVSAAKQFMQRDSDQSTVQPVTTPKPSKPSKREPFALDDDAPVAAAVSALEAAAEIASE